MSTHNQAITRSQLAAEQHSTVNNDGGKKRNLVFLDTAAAGKKRLKSQVEEIRIAHLSSSFLNRFHLIFPLAKQSFVKKKKNLFPV